MAKRTKNKKTLKRRSKNYTEADLFTLLRKRHPAPAWSTLPQVPDATGMRATRYADAISMSLWPSRGLELHGFEIKCNRSDWTKELKTPQKAEAVASYCHRWWIVAPSTKIVPLEEVPPRWGLLVVSGKGLKQAKEAELLEPRPLNYEFLAALLRRADENRKGLPTNFDAGSMVPANAIKQELEEAYKRGKNSGYAKAERERGNQDQLAKSVADFEERSGIKIDGWNGSYLGDAVKAVTKLGGADQAIKWAQKRADHLVEIGTKLQEELKELW